MPVTVVPSSTTNAPTFLSAIVLSASNTIVSGLIVQTSRPLVFNISATVSIQPLAAEFVSKSEISYRENQFFEMPQVAKSVKAIFVDGAEGGTRTPTSYLTRPSNVRVYQFRHFGKFGKDFKDLEFRVLT